MFEYSKMQDYLHIGRATDLSDKKDYRLYRALEIMPGFYLETLILAQQMTSSNIAEQ